ncbi:Uncharacterized protein FWK35_00021970 [Aphis craccivora]|uniref:Uncharacterized protein n=1 Tax=Aphis craccivora TaxID=307492 RepID=A0A6G0Y678_APHCR|nr:Uncharacterized protein FWK35_00021970 [Aphis craccivora]
MEEVFYEYFNNGIGASEALRLHESKILLEDNCWETLANGSKTPIKKTVAYLHKKWKQNNFGCVNNPLDKLIEKNPSHAKRGK